MHILVYGAGVLGSAYAARLHDAGHTVSLLARGQRLDDLRARAGRAAIPTPVGARLDRYIDPAAAPIADGSATIPLTWRSMEVGPGVLIGLGSALVGLCALRAQRGGRPLSWASSVMGVLCHGRPLSWASSVMGVLWLVSIAGSMTLGPFTTVIGHASARSMMRGSVEFPSRDRLVA